MKTQNNLREHKNIEICQKKFAYRSHILTVLFDILMFYFNYFIYIYSGHLCSSFPLHLSSPLDIETVVRNN